MSTYKELRGLRVKYVPTDTTSPSTAAAGDVWYNSATYELKGFVGRAAWSAAANANTARRFLAGCGPQTAGLMFGGYVSAASNLTEEYNGTGWSEGGNLNTARNSGSGFGTQTAGVYGGGYTTTAVASTEEYGGTSWTAGNNMGTARYSVAAMGTLTAGLAVGGKEPSVSGKAEEYDGTNWTESGDLNTVREAVFSAGTQTAGLAVGGSPVPGGGNKTESYDGSSWTAETATLNTARHQGINGAVGVQAGALVAGGDPQRAVTEEYDGTAWTETADLSAGKSGLAGGGTMSAAWGAAGYTTANVATTEEFNNTFQVVTGAVWTSGGNLNTARYGLRGCGTQTATVVAGGNVPPNSNTAAAEEYDGSSWTNVPNYPEIMQDGGMAGTQTAGLFLSGGTNPNVNPGASHEYDGSSWSAPANTPTDLNQFGMTGTQTAAITFGGYITSGPGRTDAVQNYDGSSWSTNPTSMPSTWGLNRAVGTSTAAFMAGGNNPPSPPAAALIASYDWNGSSFSSGGNTLTGMNDHGAWGTATAAYFVGGDQPTPTGGSGGKSKNTSYYNGTSFVTGIDMIVQKATFGWNNSDSSSSGVVTGGSGPGYLNNTQEFTAETSADTASTIDFD